MKAYLSIDLDYWSYSTEQSALRFFDRVFATGLPIFVAPYHDQLLPHIEKAACNTVVNVDFHSDLADLLDPPRDLLNEGTWGNFVSWRKYGKFIWRYPNERRVIDGYCHNFPCDDNPFVDSDVAGWRSTVMKKGLERLPWKSVKAIGVCLSKQWLGGAPIWKVAERLRIANWRRVPEKYHRDYLKPFYWTAA